MPGERTDARDRITRSLEAQQTLAEHATSADVLTVECYTADGQLLWQEQTAPVQVQVTDEDETRR
jgi:hypothetical protein